MSKLARRRIVLSPAIRPAAKARCSCGLETAMLTRTTRRGTTEVNCADCQCWKPGKVLLQKDAE